VSMVESVVVAKVAATSTSVESRSCRSCTREIGTAGLSNLGSQHHDAIKVIKDVFL
jgi:hypothetical protein